MNNPNNPTMTVDEHNKLLLSLNPNKILSENKEKIEAVALQNISNERASREPIPTVMNSFVPDENLVVNISFGEVSIRKMKALDITIFKLTDSPFYKLMMGDISTENGDVKSIFPDEEMIFSLIYQFTNDVMKVYKLVKKDKEQYRDIVLSEVGAKYTTQDLTVMVQEVMTHIAEVNGARIKFVDSMPIESGSVDGDKKKLI